jgi:hypothetical protein
MKNMRAGLAVCVAVAVLAPGAALAQTHEMPVPKPGPEHKLFEEDAGAWNATVETFMAPGAPPMVSNGVETNVVGCGGLCLISDFKGEMGPGQAYHGHGTTVWDPAKKKYVGSWTDSMSVGLTVGESTYDPSSKTSSGWMEGPDMTGKVVRSKGVVQYKDAKTRVFSLYQVEPGGKEVLTMRISYMRKE